MYFFCSTNQHSAFYWPDVLPVAQRTVSEHGRELNGTETEIEN